MSDLSIPLHVERLPLGVAPLFQFEMDQAVYILERTNGFSLTRRTHNPFGRVMVPMHANAVPPNLQEVTLDAILGVAAGKTKDLSARLTDVADEVDAQWGNTWHVITNMDTVLPSNRRWGRIFRTLDVDPNIIVCVHHAAGAVVLNEGPAYRALSGVAITVNGPKTDLVDVPEHSFGIFIIESNVRIFQVGA
jgi:hypothetical protein